MEVKGTIANMNQPALILVSYGANGIAELPDGSRLDVSYRRSVGRPFCGDRVCIKAADGQTPLVSRILERRNEFARADARRRKQVIAANLDQVVIVISPRPEPSTDLVERYLVAVHSMGIRPVIVVNKVELMEKGMSRENGPLNHLNEYRDLGYEVLGTSCKGEPGTVTLQPLLADTTSILVGQSGVGKSSLVNALLPDHDLQTGALSRTTGKGTHTTTTTIMYNLPGGGKLIDSPGVWEYGLWKMELQELAHGFIDIEPWHGHCRFNDCRHSGEPGCAVADAVTQGKIMQWRYEAYRRLLDQSG